MHNLYTAVFEKVYRTIFQVRDDDFKTGGHSKLYVLMKIIRKYFKLYIYIYLYLLQLKHNIIFFVNSINKYTDETALRQLLDIYFRMLSGTQT